MDGSTPRSPRTIALIVACAFFMEVLDGTVVNTALPAMARGFGTTPLSVSVGITAYLVAVAIFVPAAGWFAERFGARQVFALAIAVFTLASFACGVADGLGFFIAARIVQGAAAAFMSPVGRLVVLQETPTHRLIQALGTIIWPALIAPVVGPILGGAVIAVASWRWIFFLNLPLGVLGVTLVLKFIPSHPPGPRKRFDALGFVLTGTALALLVQGLSQLGEHGGGGAGADGAGANGAALAQTAGHAAALVAASLACGAVAVRHLRRTAAPLLSLAALRIQTFTQATLLGGFGTRIALQAAPFLLPLMFQICFGMTALQAGTMLLVYMAGNLAMKSATTAVLQRVGFRRVLSVNGLLCALTLFACGCLAPGQSLTLIYVLLFVSGATRSLNFTAVNTLAFVDIPPSLRSDAVALSTMVQQVGIGLGVALAAAALALSKSLHRGDTLLLSDFRHAWFVTGVVMVVSALDSLRLHPSAGAAASAAS